MRAAGARGSRGLSRSLGAINKAFTARERKQFRRQGREEGQRGAPLGT